MEHIVKLMEILEAEGTICKLTVQRTNHSIGMKTDDRWVASLKAEGHVLLDPEGSYPLQSHCETPSEAVTALNERCRQRDPARMLQVGETMESGAVILRSKESNGGYVYLARWNNELVTWLSGPNNPKCGYWGHYHKADRQIAAISDYEGRS